jgi:anti-anti-sigma factor
VPLKDSAMNQPASASASASSAALALGPEVTIPFAAATREQLLEALRGQGAHGDVVLDLSGITDFDSSGVQLLLSARRSVESRGDHLHLQSPSASVRDALAIFGLSQAFGLAPS